MDQARIDEFWQKYKIPLGLSFVGLVLLLSGSYYSGVFKSFATKPGTSLTKQAATTVKTNSIKIDVGGAVASPGVYDLPFGSRVADALKAAGGLSASASGEYVGKSLNLAAKLGDGMKLYVPFAGENGAGANTAVQAESGQLQSAIVSVNSGSAQELDALPGVGPVTAQKIISHRPYSDISELVSKKVVSASEYQKIKDLISL